MLHPIQERARWAYVRKMQRERQERRDAHRRWMEHNRVLLQELLETCALETGEQEVDEAGGIVLDYDRDTAAVDGMTFLFRAVQFKAGFRSSGVSIHLLPTREMATFIGSRLGPLGPDEDFDPFQHYSREVHSLEDVGMHLCDFEPYYL